MAFGATFAPDRELIGGGGGATYERTGAAGGGGGGGGGGRSGFGGVVGGGRSGDGTVVVPATAASEPLVNGYAAAKPSSARATSRATRTRREPSCSRARSMAFGGDLN